MSLTGQTRLKVPPSTTERPSPSRHSPPASSPPPFSPRGASAAPAPASWPQCPCAAQRWTRSWPPVLRASTLCGPSPSAPSPLPQSSLKRLPEWHMRTSASAPPCSESACEIAAPPRPSGALQTRLLCAWRDPPAAGEIRVSSTAAMAEGFCELLTCSTRCIAAATAAGPSSETLLRLIVAATAPYHGLG